MATSPLGGSALPFKISPEFEATFAADVIFWRLHAAWRQLEDKFEVYPGRRDGDEVAEAMLDRASEARDAMFLAPVSSASAVLAKMEACEEGCASSLIDQVLRPGISVFCAIKSDLLRLQRRELG